MMSGVSTETRSEVSQAVSTTDPPTSHARDAASVAILRTRPGFVVLYEVIVRIASEAEG
jgi:hypothetical protein